MSVTEAFTSEQVRRYLIGGGSMGAALAIVQVLAANPKFSEVVLSWGPLFLLAIIIIAVSDRRFGQLMDSLRDSTNVQRDAAVANQRLADAVQKISERDDERARELELVTAHLARSNDQILKTVKDIQEQLEIDRVKAHGHTAS